ncbi:hypothetical protein GGR51DRAFT_516444 [Nemania sp. FL0031]|nr:hypothetical protein GGR51DRAFT_516444 [Nemania sp. FL0031]
MHNGSSPEQGQILMANHFAHDREEHTNYNYITPLAADSTRAHKRTTSAPDPSSLYSIHHPATYLPTPTHIFNTESSNPAMENPGIDHPSDPEEPAGDCMHNDTTCDTGSVLRKAISHIFGRNKVCTRMIPNHIWVHLCRKHYQRSRYRSGHDYAVRQCELVLQQIQRIHDWSEENKKQGKISINKGWKLDMRKREKKRVEETENKKRRYSETDMDENTSRGTKNNTATAVPTWLRLKCGEGYSTDEILEIMRRLQGEIQAKERAQMPDLEILPDIVPDSTEETKPRAPSKRPTTHYTAHKRSKSYSMGMHASSPYVHVPGRPNSLPSWHQENYGGFTGADRWQRTMDQMPPHINHTEFRLGEAPSREASIMSHIPHPMNNIPYRPTYPYSRGNSAEGTPDNNQAVNNPHYGYDGQPVSRRFTNAPTLTASEPNTTGHGRPLHSRSVSEYTLPQASFTFRMNEPSPQQAARPIYPDQSYRAPSTSHYPSIPTQGYVRPTTETNWPHQGYTYTPRETLKHARHQSTPNPDFPYYQPHVYENSQRQNLMSPSSSSRNLESWDPTIIASSASCMLSLSLEVD